MHKAGLWVVLALAACTPREPRSAGGAEPALAVLVTREEQSVRPDGVTQLTRFQERLVRSGGRAWVERVLDPRVALASGDEDGEEDHHHGPDWSVQPQLIERLPDGGASLRFARVRARQLVRVEPPEHDSVGFVPVWSELAHLFHEDALAQLRPLERAGAPAGARWLGKDDGKAYAHVLWSDRLRLALEVESGRTDGTLVRRSHATLQPLPSPLPWAETEAWADKDITDFRD
jgi:hypothetical protein